LVLELTVAENLVLGRQRGFRRWWGLDRGRIRGEARRLVERFDVRPPAPEAAVGTLSGGNQQKVVVARELARGPAVLLAGQPTRGVDVGAIEAIHDHVRAARDAGLGVLLVSADLGELLALADRIVVMVRGRVVAEFGGAAATVAALGEAMLGAAPVGASTPGGAG
jgi:simple sugar transport system ATP-binding protein